jgi:hypothetical protein
MKHTQHDAKKPPEWLTQLLDKGYQPYIATSRHLLPYLNTEPFGQKVEIHLLNDLEDSPFMEAYFMLETFLVSNALSYEAPGMKMPRWVLIDCVLMQTAVIGFTVKKEKLPEGLLTAYREDENIAFDKINRIPVSGQIASPNIGARSITGSTLFSLGRRWLNDAQHLGLYTRALAFEVYKAREYDYYYGITQYDNVALRIHGRFTSEMEIDQPIVALHTQKDMTLVYKMKLDYDPYNPNAPHAEQEPTFWLNARDKEKKREMQKGIKQALHHSAAFLG